MNPPRPSAYETPEGFFAEMRNSCRGRLWWLPLWLYLAYIGVRQFEDPMYSKQCLMAALDMCIHEGGHVLLRGWAPEFWHVAGGTPAQIAAPIAAMFILKQQRDYFGMAFCLGWLSVNFVDISVYMADARARELPLVTAEAAGSSDPVNEHDWAYLFGQFNLMEQDTLIAFYTRAIGSGIMAVALLWGAWLMFEMARTGGDFRDSRA